MAWTKVGYAHVISTDTVNAVTAAMDTTAAGGADLLIAFGGCYAAGPFTNANITDSAGGNTWVHDSATGTLAIHTHSVVFHCFPTNLSATHTFNFHHSTDVIYPSLRVIAFKGSAGALNGALAMAYASSVQTLVASGAVGASGDLIVAGLSNDPTITGHAIDSGFTLEATDAGSANAEGGALGWHVATGAENPIWTWTTAHDAEVAILAFTGTGGAGGGIPFFLQSDVRHGGLQQRSGGFQ